MRARYGLDTKRRSPLVVATIVIIIFLIAVAFVGITMARGSNQVLLLSWQVVAADRADATFEVQRRASDELICILRAQDSKRIDVGYAEIVIPAGEPTVRVDYSLRTVAPAFAVEVLACGLPGELRVPGPQFPPGIAIPDQPWTEPAA